MERLLAQIQYYQSSNLLQKFSIFALLLFISKSSIGAVITMKAEGVIDYFSLNTPMTLPFQYGDKLSISFKYNDAKDMIFGDSFGGAYPARSASVSVGDYKAFASGGVVGITNDADYGYPSGLTDAFGYDASLGTSFSKTSFSAQKVSGLPLTFVNFRLQDNRGGNTSINSSALPTDMPKISDFEVATTTLRWENAAGNYLVARATMGNKPSYSSQGASVITAFRNYVEGAQNTDKTYQERINDCAAQGANCDFDATANDQEFRQNLQNAADATYASKDLVTRTSLLPQNKLELVADAPTLWDEIIAFFQWAGILPEDENRPEIINATVEGESGEFTVNPTFKSYELTYSIDFSNDTIYDILEGENFLFNHSLGGTKYFAGYGVVESVQTIDNGERVIFSISQLESNNAFPSDASAIPVPAPLALVGLGLTAIGWTRRKAANRSPGSQSLKKLS